jgi:hypothetical protein
MTRDEAVIIIQNIINQNVEPDVYGVQTRAGLEFDPSIILSELIVNGLVTPNWEKNSKQKDWTYEGSSL